MSFKDLYDFAQTLEPPVSRNLIRDKILELTGAVGFKFFVDGTLNPAIVRGYYVAPGNEESQFARQAGGRHAIVYARALNKCWERFVVVKEMMHLFDTELEWTNSGTDLETLLTGFYGSAEPGGEMCLQLRSEINCFWMAIGVLCPERIRVELQQKRDAGTMTDLEIAQYLKVPEVYIPQFFHARFKDVMSRLIERTSP